jgi:hypothetical protein
MIVAAPFRSGTVPASAALDGCGPGAISRVRKQNIVSQNDSAAAGFRNRSSLASAAVFQLARVDRIGWQRIYEDTQGAI